MTSPIYPLDILAILDPVEAARVRAERLATQIRAASQQRLEASIAEMIEAAERKAAACAGPFDHVDIAAMADEDRPVIHTPPGSARVRLPADKADADTFDHVDIAALADKDRPVIHTPPGSARRRLPSDKLGGQ